MISLVALVIAVLAAYLIGAIPFGYLTARWAAGIDIRTVGSGNIGATNVGRTLGFRYFVLVFLCDLLKGFLPAYAFPRLIQMGTGKNVVAADVLTALAAILGHNYPVYLGFHGGKGVATSLGALFALDAVAASAAAAGFVVFLLVTKYVSLSSILGGLVFVLVHFTRTDAPWNRDNLAMSLLTIGLLVLLVLRHRKNLVRIRSGIEPKVRLRRGESAGCAAWIVVLALACVGVSGALAINAMRRSVLSVGRYTLSEVAHVQTGHQRAERLTFADQGRLLAVSCPRYNRVVLYQVGSDEALRVYRDISLGGRPVALWATDDRLFVLQRPIADAHHLEAGYWETFDFQGERVGSLFRVGWDPDDLVVTGDGRRVLVLNSGNAEGESNRPAPGLEVFELDQQGGAPRPLGHLTFDQPNDDPVRLFLSPNGREAAVTFQGSDRVAWIDLEDWQHPRLAQRSGLAVFGSPNASESHFAGSDGASPSQNRSWRGKRWEGEPLTLLHCDARTHPASASDAVRIEASGSSSLVVRTLPSESALEVLDLAKPAQRHRLALRGRWNLNPTRLTGLAFEPRRGLLAVANRSGGLHLIAIRPWSGEPG